MSAREVITLYGPPGTGKTTASLTVVEQALENGTRPERIAYLAFTRKAAKEAASRAAIKFGLDEDALVNFRTLHSLAYHRLGLSRDQVMGPKHWRDFADKLGLELSGVYDGNTERVSPFTECSGDRALALYSMARARLRDPEEEWRLGDWSDLPRWAARDFFDKLQQYKKDNDLLDFADFLEQETMPLDVDLMVIDEAQDLTPQQWEYARRIGRNAKTILIAGDDDQAIFTWAGADARRMNAFTGVRVVLPKSYRLPPEIYEVSEGIIRQVKRRVPKTWRPNDERGYVDHLANIEHVDLSKGEWLVLARTRRGLDYVEQHVRTSGYVYQREGEWSNQETPVRAVRLYERLRRGGSIMLFEARQVASFVVDMPRPSRGENLVYEDLSWPWGQERSSAPDWMVALGRIGDRGREYVRALLRARESLTEPGRISLSTIHGSKGGEADNVLLIGGSSRRIKREFELDPDPEYRVWYVGATRAKKQLVLLGDPRP